MADSVAASEELKTEPVDQPQELPPPSPPKPKYKSWRKKFRKMRQRFDEGMEEANTLFLATHRLQDVAQRLQEQNDQLLEILMDINSSKQVPSQYRYDLTLPSDKEPQQQESPQSLYGKNEARGGDIKLDDLEYKVPHTTYDLVLQEDKFPLELQDQDDNAPAGYLTPKHEEEYLAIIDKALDVIPLPSPSRPNTIIDASVDLRPRHTSPITERDFATQNPISVHNWLLRNKPAIKMEQDQCSERGEAGSTTGTGKKKGGGRREKTKEDAPFEGLDDEIGFDAASEEQFGKSKRKSKGDGDHTYRPKGGRSRAKRKRDKGDEGEAEGKEVKKVKSSANLGGDADAGNGEA